MTQRGFERVQHSVYQLHSRQTTYFLVVLSVTGEVNKGLASVVCGHVPLFYRDAFHIQALLWLVYSTNAFVQLNTSDTYSVTPIHCWQLFWCKAARDYRIPWHEP